MAGPPSELRTALVRECGTRPTPAPHRRSQHDPFATVRVFISSTFRDFGVERAVINRIVGPFLEHHCRQRGLELSLVDMQWGIPGGTAEADTMRICLEELSRCADANGCPFFVYLGGSRYGWEPPPSIVPDDVRERFAWVDGASITAMEVLHGALRDKNPHALFFLRRGKGALASPDNDDDDAGEPTSDPDVLAANDGSAAAAAKQRVLLSVIRANAGPSQIVEYDTRGGGDGDAAGGAPAPASPSSRTLSGGGAGAEPLLPGHESVAFALPSRAPSSGRAADAGDGDRSLGTGWGGSAAGWASGDVESGSGSGAVSPPVRMTSLKGAEGHIDFQEQLRRKLTALIDAAYPPLEDVASPSSLEGMHAAHAMAARGKVGRSVARPAAVDQILEAAAAAAAPESECGIVVVVAPSGLGKSTVVAEAALRAALASLPSVVHFVAHGEGSSVPAVVAQRLVGELAALERVRGRAADAPGGAAAGGGDDDDDGASSRALYKALAEEDALPRPASSADPVKMCAVAAHRLARGWQQQQQTTTEGGGTTTKPPGHAILFVDAVDSLDGTDAATKLAWLPPPDVAASTAGTASSSSPSPSPVRPRAGPGPGLAVVLSTTPGPEADYLAQHYPKARRVVLASLSPAERAALLEELLSRAHKRLTPEHRDTLLSKDGSDSPLWLHVAVQHLRLRAVHETLDDALHSLPADVGALVASEVEHSLRRDSRPPPRRPRLAQRPPPERGPPHRAPARRRPRGARRKAGSGWWWGRRRRRRGPCRPPPVPRRPCCRRAHACAPLCPGALLRLVALLLRCVQLLLRPLLPPRAHAGSRGGDGGRGRGGPPPRPARPRRLVPVRPRVPL
jgi:hypothetical protein